MATDAEITLKFTAEIQEALKAIRMLRDEIEKIKAAGGFLSPEDMELISEMKAKLDEYTRTVRELQIEYYRLQQRSGEMSAEFIAQVTNLRKQLIELQDQISNLNDKLADQGVQIDSLKKKVKELQDSHKKTEDNGVNAYRSLRSAIVHFIVNLAKGKLAVNELGMALKGLAYSTVILAAISAAMDGIRLAWDAIKGVFGQSEEAMEEAKRKAEEAEEQLKQTKEAAVQADNAIRDARQELARTDEQNALKQMIDESIKSLREEKQVADDLLDTINKQAAAEASKRAIMAEQSRHKYAMRRLDLDTKKLNGQLDNEQYAEAVERLNYEEREEKRQAEESGMDAKLQQANKKAGMLQDMLNKTLERIDELETDLAQYLSDKEIKVMEKDLAALKTRQAAAVRRYNEFDTKVARELEIPAYKRAKEKEERGEQLTPNDESWLKYGKTLQEKLDSAKREVEMYGNLVDQQEKELKTAKEGTAKREKITAELNELGNQATQLTANTKRAQEEADNLASAIADKRNEIEETRNSDYFETQGRIGYIRNTKVVRQGKEASKARQKELQKKDSDYNKQQQRKQEMERLAADIAEQAQIAAGTSKDTDDKAVLDKIRNGINKYGAAFNSVLAQQDGIVSAVEMLQANTDRNERTLKELQGRIDKLVKQGKVQDTRNRKRSSL